MQLGFFNSGVAGQMMQDKMDIISHNLANVNTQGYMEDRTSFSSSFSSAMQRNGEPSQTSTAFLSTGKQYVSTQSGIIRHTGSSHDFAIQGDGYFRVKLANGTEALTRAGNFKIDAQGNLLTQGNLPVLDKAGSAIQLPIGEVSATKEGAISVNEEQVAELGISMVKDPRQITKLDGVLIQTPASNIKAADESITVHQGSVEESNVNSILLMASMVNTMREYQSMMKIVEQFNQQAGLLSDRVGLVQG